MKGRAIKYSDDELSWIKANKSKPRSEAHAEFCKAFNRSDVTAANYKALCNRNGWLTGRTGAFVQGHKTWNKGKNMPFNANSARTQFRKGNLPHTTNYLGHERVSQDGYVEISVAEKNPHTGYERRYVLKHRWLWEKQNGKLPKGMALKCLDGDKTNTDPSNWVAIPRSMLPRLGTRWGRDYDSAPAELKPAILAVARLEDATMKAEREEEIA